MRRTRAGRDERECADAERGQSSGVCEQSTDAASVRDTAKGVGSAYPRGWRLRPREMVSFTFVSGASMRPAAGL
jgi:hypothetical protein